jgi:ABC-type bacteriocin/lantibiotic exporter with double-glycine peptidase domain
MNKKKILIRCFNSKFFYLGFMLIFFQQLLVAASVAFLIEFVKFDSSKSYFVFLYIFSLFAPYIPGSLAIISFKKWEFFLLKEIVDSCILLFKKENFFWEDQEKKKKIESAFSKEIPELIFQLTSFVFLFLCILLNTLLTLLVSSFYIEKNIIYSILFGIFLAVFVVNFLQKKRDLLVLEEQEKKIDLNYYSRIVWDNLVLGNSYNSNCWELKFYEKLRSLLDVSLKASFLTEFINFFSSVLALSPFVLMLIYVFYKEKYSFFSLVVTLPRIFQTFNYVNNFICSFNEFRKFFSKIKKIYSFFSFPSHEEKFFMKEKIKSRIKDISIYDKGAKKFFHIDEFIENIKMNKILSGRFVLTGNNGSGKSSLLRYLKFYMNENAFYIPQNNDLVFKNNFSNFSTGEQVKFIFKEISDLNVKALLLDEWSANLDSQNLIEISKLLDLLSQKYFIVEAVHRSCD